MAPRKPLDQLSPAYRKRIESAERRGKTRQEARGHQPPRDYRSEYELRKERAEAKYGTSNPKTIKAIRYYLSVTGTPLRTERGQAALEFVRAHRDSGVEIADRIAARKGSGKRMRWADYIRLFDGIEGIEDAPDEAFYYHDSE